MFDSPFEYCKVCGEIVLLDQTRRQCAAEHRCREPDRCPLARYFGGIEFRPGTRRKTGGEPSRGR